MKQYTQLVKDAVLNPDVFVRGVFSGRRRGHAAQWKKVVLRPVLIRDKRHLQFSYFDDAKDVSKNYAGAEAEAHLDALLGTAFKQIAVQTTEQDIQVRISNKGEPTVTTTARAHAAIKLTHDRHKSRILSLDNDRTFLTTIGIATDDGAIKADMQRKFLQINEFLKLVDETEFFNKHGRDPVHMVDFGCGNAYLTFAMYQYVTQVRGLPAQLAGVDVKADLIARNTAKAQALGWQDLHFVSAGIGDFEPATPPDVVLALHACDTATDEALARGITWHSSLIMSAPCCQHHLQAQLEQQPTPHPFQPVFRHAILKERMGDILTDTFRALILRIAGYTTDVIQFIATEHTPKNLMIRAVRRGTPGDPELVQAYNDLKALWGVTPYLETLLGTTWTAYTHAAESTT
jgi:SAM-dependent methyltransferase